MENKEDRELLEYLRRSAANGKSYYQERLRTVSRFHQALQHTAVGSAIFIAAKGIRKPPALASALLFSSSLYLLALDLPEEKEKLQTKLELANRTLTRIGDLKHTSTVAQRISSLQASCAIMEEDIMTNDSNKFRIRHEAMKVSAEL